MRNARVYIAPPRHPVVGHSLFHRIYATMVKWSQFRRLSRRAAPKAKRYAAGAIATAVAQKLNAGQSITRTLTTDEGSGGAITGQRYAKTDYRKRRLTKRQRYRARRRWRRKRSFINAVRNADIGTTHILRRSLCNLTTPSGLSGYVGFGLNSLDGQPGEAFNTHDDIGEVFDELAPASWSAVLDPGVDSDIYKLHQYHATAEYTIRNNNTNPNTEAVVEAYFIYGRKPVDKRLALAPADVYTAGFKKQAVTKGEEPGQNFEGALVGTQVGVTPFQNALFCRHFKIYKRQKFLIPPGDEVSFVINDRRFRQYSMDRVKGFSTDRNYIGVLFQQQGCPAAGADPPTVAQATALSYLCTRRYRFKLVRQNLVNDALETSG